METTNLIAWLVAFGVISWAFLFFNNIWHIKKLKVVATKLGFSYSKSAKSRELQHPDSRLFEVNTNTKQYLNVMSGEYRATPCEIFEFSYREHSSQHTNTVVQTIFVFESSKSFSFAECIHGDKINFFLLETTPEELDIKLMVEEFDTNYGLQGKEIKNIKRWFRKVGAHTMLSTERASMAWQGKRCMFYVARKQVPSTRITEQLKQYHHAFIALETELP
ncbi:MAG: hypothetical protein COB04_17755 [Gammaproteobacteria bacterium]|nr:MAG: hypothetical protein COB04_17755 [Gammaproteobacteria bacterium]